MDDRDFTLHHRAEILGILDCLQQECTMTTVETGDGQAIVSRVLEVRRAGGHAPDALVFDVSRDADANRALFAAQALSFVTELDGVQIAFETVAAESIVIADGPAALVALPTAVTRLQRREWFRALLPMEPPIRCTVRDANGRICEARAIDLSCGGVGVIVDGAVEAELGDGRALFVSLPEVGTVAIDATLCDRRRAGATTDALKIRLGFRFDRVPAKTASQIQRYVQKLEVDQLRVLRRRRGTG